MPKHNPIRHDLITVGAVLALTTVEWWENRDHHDLWERVYNITRAVIVGACVIAALLSLGACKPSIEQGTVDKLNNSMAVTR